MNDRVFHALAEAARQHEPVTLGLISGVKGSSPQKLGAKAVFFADGRIVGTLGGGCLEAEIQQRALRALRTNQPDTFDLLLDHDFGWDDGLICGGKVEGLILPNAQEAGEGFWLDLQKREKLITWGVRNDFGIHFAPAAEQSSSGADWRYVEQIRPPCALWIAGAGHIAQAVAPLAANLDFAVSVFDDRPALANRQFFPASLNLFAEAWDTVLSEPLPDTPCFALIVTRGHRHDALVLREWIQKPFLFLGMIGSRRKARAIFEHFLEEKLATREQLARVACPVGLDIQSRSVMEIAVSIMGQFIQKRAELVSAGARK